MRMSDGSGVEHVMQAMEEGLPGCRDKTFTTCGKPKVRIPSTMHVNVNPNLVSLKLKFTHTGGGGSIRQPATVLLGRGPQGDGQPGYLEDDPGAVGLDACRAAKVHSTELCCFGCFKPGRKRTPMLNELLTSCMEWTRQSMITPNRRKLILCLARNSTYRVRLKGFYTQYGL